MDDDLQGEDTPFPEDHDASPDTPKTSPSTKPGPTLVLAVAKISLPGLHVGNEYWVDTSVSYVARAIEAGYLVPSEER
jgi:hypothetical protein